MPHRSAGTHGGPTRCRTDSRSAPLHHRLFDHGAITVREDLRVRVARASAGSSARYLFKELDGQELRLPVDQQFFPGREHLRWHHARVFQGRQLAVGTSHFCNCRALEKDEVKSYNRVLRN
jgi:hypothetical protein